MQIIKTFLVTALVITTTIVAALPATSDSLIQLSSKIKLDDPGIWNYTVCNAICLIEENNCRRNKGISKELCADEVCTFNQAYVSNLPTPGNRKLKLTSRKVRLLLLHVRLPSVRGYH
jgi:hypothetical protein